MTTINEVKERMQCAIDLLDYFIMLENPLEFFAAIEAFNTVLVTDIPLIGDLSIDKQMLRFLRHSLKKDSDRSLLDLKDLDADFIGVKSSKLTVPLCASSEDFIVVDPGFYVLSDSVPKKTPLHYFRTRSIKDK